MGKPVILIGVGVVFAAVAAFMTLGYLKGQQGNVIQAELDTSTVVVASKTIPRGAFVKPEDVRLIEWPSETAPQGAFNNIDQALGKLARATIFPNDLLTEERVLDNRAPGVLSMLIPDGQRAISIKVNEVTGISGFVAPGSRVDVLLSVSGRDEMPARTRTVLQDVEVLAIAQTIEQRDSEPVVVNTVTLNVSPDGAERLTLAGNEGSLQLILRNDQDDAQIVSVGTNIDQVIGLQSGMLDGRSVEIISGTERANISF